MLTRTADYGVRAMMHLAGLEPGARASARAVAVAADVPAGLMSKILQRLASARLVVSHRGKRGGFQLARPPAQISLLDVVEAMDGPLAVNVCVISDDACPRRPGCGAHVVWAELQRRMAAVLGDASLEQLVRTSELRRAAPTLSSLL